MLRKKAGLTQKSLAEKLFISDKAVSKWERGLSYPDVSFINKLSKLFDIDTDALFIEEDKTIASNWIGIVYFPDVVNRIKFSDKINSKYIIEILMCYFILAEISHILIVCDGDNYKFANIYIRSLKTHSLSINVVKTKDFRANKKTFFGRECANSMLIYDLFFIYGVGLTSSFQRVMLDKSKLTILSNPRIPVVFGPTKKILRIIDNKDYIKNADINNLFRGYLAIILNSQSNVKKCSKLIKTIEDISGNNLYSIVEVLKARHL